MDDLDQEKPEDLSMKSSRKIKPIPPPLDLSLKTYHGEQAGLSRSPGNLLRECLPLRKRSIPLNL